MEHFTTFLLLLFAYTLVVPLFNYSLRCAFSWRGKLPKPKKYQSKKSPIYNLVKYNFENYYQIQKWVLRYRNTDEEWFAYFIPFMSLFEIYKYDLEGSLGDFKIGDIHSLKSLEVEYEAISAVDKKQWDEAQILKQRRLTKIEDLNTEFNNNYIR